MSWSILIPKNPDNSILTADVIAALSQAPDEPENIGELANADEVRAQVKLCKSIARSAVVQCSYRRVRVQLGGHTNADGAGDSFGVTVFCA